MARPWQRVHAWLFGRQDALRYSVISYALGLVLGLSLVLMFVLADWWEIFAYLAILAFMHESEFVSVATFHPHTLSTDSFLINHSREYSIAFVTSVVEYFLEKWALGDSTAPDRAPTAAGVVRVAVSVAGLAVVAVGLAVRIGALFTGGKSFTHDIALKKEVRHELVTHGLYGYTRHPGYVGWTVFSVGTQLVLRNPVCAVGYAVALYKFFADRIPFEEQLLVKFFGDSYIEYRKRVPSGFPGIP